MLTRSPILMRATVPFVSLLMAGAGGCAKTQMPPPTAANVVTTTGASVEREPTEETPSPALSTADILPPVAATPPPETAETPLTDDQIASVLDAAESAAIEQAQEGARRARSATVRFFAAESLVDYGVAHSKLAAVETKESMFGKEGVVADEVQARAEGTMASLQSSTEATFDTAYIEARVSSESALLSLLDDRLLPQARNPDLRSYLQRVRTLVAGSLKEARSIQSVRGVR
jgi:putative membrane protein